MEQTRDAPDDGNEVRPPQGRLRGAIRHFTTKDFPTRPPISAAHTRTVM